MKQNGIDIGLDGEEQISTVETVKSLYPKDTVYTKTDLLKTEERK